MQSVIGLLMVLIVWLVCENAACERSPECSVPSGGIHLDFYPPNEE